MLQRTERSELGQDHIRRNLMAKAVRLAHPSWADPDDLVQDTLERALRNLHRFEPGSNLSAWLATIMRRLIIDHHRRERFRAYLPVPDVAAPEPDDPPDPQIAALTDPDLLEEAISRLPESFRCVLFLHATTGLPYAEIARRLALPIGTVGTRILRARRLLRSYVAAQQAL